MDVCSPFHTCKYTQNVLYNLKMELAVGKQEEQDQENVL